MKKEITIMTLASIILALTVSYKNTDILTTATISFLIIIIINILTKKIIAKHFEIDIKTKFWTLKQFGLRQDMHFKNPVPMAWLPLLITLFTKGNIFWLGILEFDAKAKPERASKRHGLYRFTEITEWHMAWIATWGIIANFIALIIAYIAGFELFAKLSIYFIAWSIIPIGRLDGTKLYFGSRALWTVVASITLIVLTWELII
jgi:hypothetical protein